MGTKESIDECNRVIERNQEYALSVYRELKGDPDISLQSLKSTICGQNEVYTAVSRKVYLTPNDFIAGWIKGLNDRYLKKDDENRAYRFRHVLLDMLKDEDCQDYIFAMLYRNFYRNEKARKRPKYAEELWDLWIGDNNHMYGLLLAPIYENKHWKNDVSEIRRAKYEYWTMGHILDTGFVENDKPEAIKFSDVCEFIDFYRKEFRGNSKSVYEKEIIDRYLGYLLEQDNPKETLLLIPELRFGKQRTNHLYRLDFAVLNSYTGEMIGFEISPCSTHMAIKGKTDIEKSENNRENWEKETQKRNDYYKAYDIPIITFSDKRLNNIDDCFGEIKTYLERRNEPKPILEEELKRAMLC